jgi:hypothetical protein
MPGNILTTDSTIQCPHGGKASLMTSNAKTSAGAQALLETDKHTVSGCLFTLPGPKPSPCMRIEWSAGASKVTVNGTAVLVESSVGKCLSPEGSPQGVATVVNTQQKASTL